MRSPRTAASALLAAAVAVGLVACAAGDPAPAPAARSSGGAPATSTAAADPAAARTARFQDPAAATSTATSSAEPVRIEIPSIGVDAHLLHLQRGPDGVLQAPPSDELQDAGWYSGGTVPGQTGPAVIAGHLDWVHEVAVFHRLAEVRPGAGIAVVMDDGSTVRFTVDRVRTAAKDRFPTQAVYGPTPDAQLRVITCGGPWDDARDIYSDNVIVSATEAA